MIVNKDTKLEDYPNTRICWSYWLTALLSNGVEIKVQRRATLYGYIQRGYYTHNDTIERAKILSPEMA